MRARSRNGSDLAESLPDALCLCAVTKVEKQRRSARAGRENTVDGLAARIGDFARACSMPTPLIVSREAVADAQRSFGAFGMAVHARELVLALAHRIDLGES